MASKNAIKDNFQALLGKENYSKGVVVKTAEAGSIAVDVYTVLSYGTKISEVSKNIQERVKFSLENQLGITTDTVNVYIQNIKNCGRIIVSKITTSLFKKWSKQGYSLK